MATIKDVAREAGTSISTVSHVINDTKHVAPELRVAITQAIDRLGYQVNPLGRSLKSRRTNRIGVLITDMNRIFFPPLVKGIQNVLDEHGYQLTICDFHDKEEREHAYINMLRNTWVDGILLDSITPLHKEAHFHHLSQMRKGSQPIPIVSLERRLPTLDSVGVDNVAAGKLAVEHLLEVGCRQIAFLSGPLEGGLSRERYLGYQAAHLGMGRPVRDDLFIMCDFSPLSGYQAAQTLMDSGIPFDGIFAANDQMAIGALAALREGGLEVPQRVKVVGFDNTFVASLSAPTLTTVSVPIYDMGRIAAEMLMERLRGAVTGPARWRELPVTLVVRQSSSLEGDGTLDMAYW